MIFSTLSGNGSKKDNRILPSSKVLMTFLILLCSLTGARAQKSVTVYDGPNVTTFPPANINNFSKYNRTQFMIPAGLLEDLKDGNINALKFYTYYSSGLGVSSYPKTGQTAAPVDVYLKEVTYDAMSTLEPKSGCTVVYQGKLSVKCENNDSGSLTITFTTPFHYSGGNLIIGVDNTAKADDAEVMFVGDGDYKYFDYSRSVSSDVINGIDDKTPGKPRFVPKTTLFYTGGASCPTPTALEVSLTPGDGTTATLDWTENGSATQWEICLDGDETNPVTANTKPFTLTGLTPEKAYTAQVRAVNSDTDKSVWSNSVAFEPTSKTAIGSGSNKSEYYPVEDYCKYSLTQQIYTVDELGEAGTIENIAFYHYDDARTRMIKIYMVNTDKSCFNNKTDWVSVTAGDIVFSGNVTFASNAWTSITLDNTFFYNGLDNVLLVVDDNTGSYENSTYFSVFETSLNQTITISSDYTDFDPTDPSGYSGFLYDRKNQIRVQKSSNLYLTLELTDSYGDGWDGNAIRIVDVETGDIIGTYANKNLNGATGDGTNEVNIISAPVPIGREIQFQWINGDYTGECSWVVYDEDGVLLFSGNGNGSTTTGDELFTYTVEHNPCARPTGIAVTTAGSTGATMVWEGDHAKFDLRYGQGHTNHFEDGLGSWTTIDADGDGFTWLLSNIVMDFKGHESDNCIFSQSFDFNGQQALEPDNYLVSPRVALGGSISFWAKAQDEDYSQEHFGVAVSTTGNTDADDFTTIQEWTVDKNNGAWKKYTVDLSAYSGKGYVAIRHFDCTDQFYLDVDDITIYEPWIQISDIDANTCNLTGLNEGTAYIVQLRGYCDSEGLPSKWTNDYSFTTISSNVFITAGNWNEAGNWQSGIVPADGSNVVIRADVTVPSGSVADAGRITVENGATITVADGGQLKYTNSGLTVTMQKSIEGYGVSNGGYYLIANPFKSHINATDYMGMSDYGDYDLYGFEQNGNGSYDVYGFVSVPGTDGLEWRNNKAVSLYLYNGEGYLYAHKDDQVMEFSGELNPTNVNVKVTLNKAASSVFEGFNLVGNPYACNAYLADGRGFYVLNDDGSAIVPSTTNVIPPMAAVFVEASAVGALNFTTTAPASYTEASAGIPLPMLPMHNLTDNQDANIVVELTESDGVTELESNTGCVAEVTFTRSFTEDVASTVCLPFTMASVTGGTLYEFVDVTYSNTDGWVATMQENVAETPTVAGRPYLFMPNSTGNVTLRGIIASVPATLTAGESSAVHSGGDGGTWTFHGTYGNITWDSSMGTFFGFASSNEGTINPGDFVRAKAGASVPSFRCYLTYSGTRLKTSGRDGTNVQSDQIPNRIKVVLMGADGTITSVGSIDTDTGDVKIDTWYDMNGRELPGKPAASGLYIHQGKAVMIK